MATPIIIIGTGIKAQAALEIFQANDLLVYGFLSEQEGRKNETIHEVPILGAMQDKTFLDLCDEEANPFLALEDEQQQQILGGYFQKRKRLLPNAIHPQTFLSKQIELGEGNLILHASAIGLSTRLGSYNFLEEQVIIRSGAHLADHIHIGAGTLICHQVTIAAHVTIGARSLIMPGVKIKAHTTIPPASIITQDP